MGISADLGKILGSRCGMGELLRRQAKPQGLAMRSAPCANVVEPPSAASYSPTSSARARCRRHKPPSAITTEDVQRLKNSLNKKAQKTVNNVLTG